MKMEKATDSSVSSTIDSSGGSGVSATTAAGCSNGTTTASNKTNQNEQIVQKNFHNSLNNSASATPTKNHLNSLGCGSSSITTTAATPLPLLLDRGGCRNMVVGGSSNLNSNNVISSLNSTSLGHQSTNKTTTNTSNTNTTSKTLTTNNTATLSNIASSSGSASNTSTSITTTTSLSSSSLSSSSSSQMAPINLNISTTTGGNFSVSVDPQITVENLKKIIAKKLKVAKDRICLLHREKELQDGLLKENNLMDGSKIILIPNVETGLLAQRPENTVMQALESLNDSQVNDFLSGKTPLNLSMRLGDHMMLIQLQLSTVNPVNGVAYNGANCSSSSSRQRSSHHHHHHHRSSRTATTASAATQTAAGIATTSNHSHHHHHHHHHHHSSNTAVTGSATTSATLTPTAVSVATTAENVTAVRKLELDATCQTPRSNISTSTLIAPHPSRTAANTSSSKSSSSTTKASDLSSFLSKRDYESLQNIVKSIAMAQPSRLVQQSVVTTSNTTNSSGQSPSIALPAASDKCVPVVAASSFHTASETVLLEQSPIKSLSNLVSSPIKTTAIQNIPQISNNTNSSSLNNSVALGPHTASISSISATSSNGPVASANTSICQDPIAAKLTSCLCTRLNSASLGAVNNMPHASAKQCIETACITQQQLQTSSPLQHHHNHHHSQQQLQSHTARASSSTIITSTPNYKATITPGSILTALNGTTNSSLPLTSSPSRSSSSLHKTAHNPISRKHRHHHHHHHHHHHYHHSAIVQQQLGTGGNQKIIANTSTPTKISTNDSGFNSGDDSSIITTTSKSLSSSPVSNITQSSSVKKLTATTPVVATTAAPIATSNSNANSTTITTNAAAPIELDDAGIVSDSRTLAEASRNLTQTLRKLSKEVFTNKIDFSANEETPRKSGSGAVIESMKNHGKGIYSGTFSGTLNPALQDRYGRPKRDISTVIHILNDLLSATPQYHRGARISFEAPSTSAAAAASVAAASGSTGAVHHSSRNKHVSSKHHQSSHPCVKCIKTHNASASTINLQTASASNGASGPMNSHSSVTSSSVCAYGECNGHYVSNKSQSAKTYPCCHSDLTIAATSSSSSSSSSSATSNPALGQQPQVAHSGATASTTSTNGGHHHHHHHHQHGSSHQHHHHHHHHQMVDERKVCQCRYRVHSETGERERDYTCQKCAAELDNIKTKSKLDQLRLVMQQRKQKREARKLKGAPYGARVVGTTTTATASGVTDNTASTLTASNSTISTPISVATSATTPSEVSPNHLVEEVDTAA